MLKVLTAQNPMEAHLAQGILEAQGIASQVRGADLFSTLQGGTSMYGLLPSVWILDEDQASRAEELLAAFLRAQEGASGPGEAWACPGCGEALEPQFTSCWHCGAERPEPREAPEGV